MRIKKIKETGLIALAMVGVTHGQENQLRFAGVFANNMVIQQESEAPIWGWTEPGESVKIKAGWGGRTISTKADESGRWEVRMKTPKAGGPYKIEVRDGDEKVSLTNVLLGEVWICSGQSNMQWKMRGFGSELFKKEIQAAKNDQIRLCTFPQILSLEEQEDIATKWQACSPSTVNSFSIVAYFFGKQLEEELDVPIGLISTNWGGSRVEAWMSESALSAGGYSEFDEVVEKYEDIIKASGAVYPRGKKVSKGLNHCSPSVLYNHMIRPLIPMSFRGVIWYQGESNVKAPEQYARLFPDLIHDWRAKWGQGDFPFYYVQIAPFVYKAEKKPAALLREAQLKTLSVPNTGMVVTMDVGDATNIHPKRKKPVADRLVRLALAKTYGKEGISFSGPIYKSMTSSGKKVKLDFEHVGEGLASRDGEPLTHFQIAGSDKKFVPAQAEIEGESVIVWSDEISRPKAVRFGWGNADEPNFMNKEGLPASSFRTDEWSFE